MIGNMARFMLHLKNDKFRPPDSRELVHKARNLCSDMNASVRVARVASKFIEFDIEVEKEKLDLLIDKFSSIGKLDNARHIVEEKIIKETGIKDGIFYFNNERFWECHEAFEGVWKECYGREKELVQGIILLAVAFAHSQKNDYLIGLGMLGRALEKLGTSPIKYHNIDVDLIRSKIIEMQKSKTLTIFEI
jgi:predicted metal-dependent hydrolase